MKFNTCPIKRASSFLLVLLVVFTFTPYSYAENITPNANKDETKKKVQETKETWQQKKLETRVKVIEKVKFHGSIMIKRYEAAVSRFENIILRIEKRVESARSGGIDTSKIEASLSAIKAKIESTKSSLALARSSIESISPQGDENQIKSVIEQVKTILKTEKQNLIDLHQSLKLVVTELKTINGDGRDNTAN